MHDSPDSTAHDASTAPRVPAPRGASDDAHPRRFPKTSWTLIRQAAHDPSSLSSRKALQQLCKRYRLPVYLFIRRHCATAELANDCTQSFFAHLHEKNTLSQAEPKPDRKFRSWLLTCAKNHLRDVLRREAKHPPSSGIDTFAEDRYQRLKASTLTAERLYERQFAHEVIAEATALSRARCTEEGKLARFELLSGYLPCGPEPLPYPQIASTLGISREGVRKAVHDLRAWFKDDLRTVVGRLVDRPEDIDAELRALRDALAPEADDTESP